MCLWFAFLVLASTFYILCTSFFFSSWQLNIAPCSLHSLSCLNRIYTEQYISSPDTSVYICRCALHGLCLHPLVTWKPCVRRVHFRIKGLENGTISSIIAKFIRRDIVCIFLPAGLWHYHCSVLHLMLSRRVYDVQRNVERRTQLNQTVFIFHTIVLCKTSGISTR